MYDTRKYIVIQRPSGQLAITTPDLSGPNPLRPDMKVIRRSDGGLQIVKRHRHRHRHVKGKVQVTHLRGAFELNGHQLNFGITHTRITGELARQYYIHNVLYRRR